MRLSINRIINRIKQKLLKKNYYCRMCSSKVAFWGEFGSDAEVYKSHHIIAGGKRACQCPFCGSIDRGRWVDYILEKYTDIYKSQNNVLHIAPEIGIGDKARKVSKGYISADLNMEGVDVFLDVTDIPFKDGWFDFVIMNHVLSYIEDEAKVMTELSRVLKADGKLMISFPICMEYQKTFEKKGLDSKESYEIFGTEGNCRMYGQNYVDEMKKYGFDVVVYTPSIEIGSDEIVKNGYLEDDILLILTKRAN